MYSPFMTAVNPLKVVFWVGATGTGKSHLAMEMAPHFQAAIVNADSVQMYERLDIGSAKPTLQERSRVPHFLFDFIRAPDTMTAGEFNRKFFELADQLKSQFKVLFVVGGTGFYYQAIEKGLLPIPKANADFQNRIFEDIAKNENAQKYHEELAQIDPITAKRIHPRDHYRIVRALDIIQATNKPLSQILADHQTQGPRFPFPLLKIGLQRPKPELEAIIQARTKKMISDGLVQEVQTLTNDNLKDWEPLRSVGYKQCVDFLSNQISATDLPEKITQETMKLAKKQKTWFSRDAQIIWHHPNDKEAIQSKLATFLNSQP